MTILVLCVLVNALQYHDTDDFVQDSETEDPQLCFYAERLRFIGDSDLNDTGNLVWLLRLDRSL